MSGARPRVAGALLLAAAWGFRDGFFVAAWPAAFWSASAAGLLCLVAGSRPGRRAAAVAQALTLEAVIAALQVPLPVAAAHLHRIPAAAQAAAALLDALGLPAGIDGDGNLLVRGASGAHAFALTWEMAAAPMILRALVSIAITAGSASLARNALALVACGALRALAMVVLVLGGARYSIVYEPGISLACLLPLVFLLRDTDGRETPAPARVGPRPLRAGAAVACLAAGGLALGLAWGFRAVGPAKQGRVLIDESHSDWEWTDIPFDRARYGQKSLYNYSLWRTWIDLHFPTRAVRTTPSESDLAAADVLVVKTPTSPYDAAAVARIERFVREGGGLFLIGDHTNLFGMSTVLNGLAAPFGLAFEFDDTFPLDHEAADVFHPGSLGRHPILRGIDSYPFETSCTLRVPWSADHLMIGRRLGAEMVDWGHVNFFGNIRLDPPEMFGLFVQAALVDHGKGRVAAFSDSTNFSNFSLLWPGRRELTLNIIDWLDRRAPEGVEARARIFAFAAGLALAALGWALASATGPWARAAAAWAALGCCLLGCAVAGARTEASLGTPPARTPYRSLAFDTEISSFKIDPASAVLSRDGGLAWDDDNALFINAARSGSWPEVTRDLVAALQTHATMVLVSPVRPPSRRQIEALVEFVARGGRLLVLESVLNTRSTAASILAPFGLSAEREFLSVPSGGVEPARRAVARAPSGAGAPGASHRVTAGGVEMVWRDVGKGRIVLAADAALFTDRGLGGVYASPDGDHLEVYRSLSEVLDVLIGSQPPAGAP